MSELEDVSFWPGSSDGSYTRVGGAGTAPACTCRRRTVLILIAVVLIAFIISVSIPAGLMQKYKSEAAEAKAAASKAVAPQPTTTISTTTTTTAASTTATTTTATPTTTTSTPIPPASNYRWNKYRLPTSVLPSEYLLYIDTDLHGEAAPLQPAGLPDSRPITFTGNVSIRASVTADTDLVVMHSAGLNISDIKVNDTTIAADGWKLNADLEQLEISLNQNYTAGSYLSLVIEFKGQLSDKLRGFYRSSYKVDEAHYRTVASTQFESVFARRAFPCFDEPSFKATFQLRLTKPKGWMTLFNTKSTKIDQPVGGDESKLMDEYEPSPIMSSYLVAYVICDYKATPVRTTNTSKVNVTLYASPNKLSQLDWAQEVAVIVLEEYEHFFNLSYPLTKLDILALPEFGAGAMENWGLITFRESDLLYDPVKSSSHTKMLVAEVVAHELAHQWFGNYVTMKWWNELWLNEGFATWVGTFIGTQSVVTANNESWQMDLEFVHRLRRAMSLDVLTVSHPLSMSADQVNSMSDIESRFNPITYDKGAAILRMLDDYVGRNVTRTALSSYLSKHKYSNTEAADLWAEFDQVHTPQDNHNVTELMSSWTNAAGIPLIEVKVDSNGSLMIKQSRFFECSACNKSEEQRNTTWVIPVKIRVSEDGKDDNDTYALIYGTKSEPSGTVPAGAKYYVNPDWVGYYQVSISSDVKAPLDRAKDDSDYLQTLYAVSQQFRAGLIDGQMYYDVAQSVHSQRADQHSPLVYAAGVEMMTSFQAMLSNEFDIFDKVRDVVYDYMNVSSIAVTYEKFDNLTYMDRKETARRLTKALKLDHERVLRDIPELAELTALWTNYTKNPNEMNITSVIHSDLFTSIGLCSFLAAEDDLWPSLWQNYLSNYQATRQLSYLFILSSAQTTHNVQRILAKITDESSGTAAGLRTESSAEVLYWVSDSQLGQQLLWSFMLPNWDTLVAKYGDTGFDMDRIVTALTQHLSTENEFKLMKDFFDSHELQAGKASADQMLEKIRIAIYIRENQLSSLKAALPQ